MVLLKTFKAVIVKPDRTTDVFYINKKKRLGSNAFYLGKNKDKIEEIYIIDPSHTVITTTKRLGIPFNYQTCYYKKGVPVAVPIDVTQPITSDVELEQLWSKPEEEGGKPVGYVINANHPIPMPEFNNMEEYDHITSEELAQLFNPQFYKMIARANTDKKSEQMWIMQIVTLGGIGFIIYYMMQSLPKAILKVIAGYVGG